MTSAAKLIRRFLMAVFATQAAVTILALNSDAKEACASAAFNYVVDQAVQTFLKNTPQAVGLSIGVVSGREVCTYNFGTVERGSKRTPTSDTLYPIASVTKTFTGTLLAQAAIEKRLNLDDDVRKYLDGNFPNLEFQGQWIRLLDLLDHRSGLPFFLPDRPEAQPGYDNDRVPWPTRVNELLRNYTRANFFEDLHLVKLEAAPGTQFRYSNAAAQLAGYILERVYGTSYESLLKRKVFDLLKMRNTAITLRPEQRVRLAHGYDEDGNLMPENPDRIQAAGAIKSTVNDLLKYVQWQIRESDEAVRLSHQPVFTSGDYSAGLNWQMLRSGNKRVIWQEGNIAGFNSLCLSLPDQKIGLVVLANEEDPAASHQLTVMSNAILKGLDREAVLLP
jgi:CubicO group peptidase (beta-lactamase class C family)